MPRIEPIGLEPLVGFAFWHLDRGWSLGDTLGALANDPRYAAFPPDQLVAAVDRAWDNFVATTKARENPATLTLIDAIGKVLLRAEPVGVRVTIIVILPGGNKETVSVTVNANSNMTIEEVLAHVRLFVDNGGLIRPAGSITQPVIIDEMKFAIVEGGFSNPAYDISNL